MSTTIRKVVFAGAGGPEVVSVFSAEIQAPAANEVQMKVLYAGMGGADVAMRVGCYPQQKSPVGSTPGYSLVGRVHQNGANCSTPPRLPSRYHTMS